MIDNPEFKTAMAAVLAEEQETRGLTVDDYLRYHVITCLQAAELSRRKNNDYAAPNENKQDPRRVFRNFMQVQHLGVCDAEQGILVRLSDKFSRLANILRPSHRTSVNEESFEDTCDDIINYVQLLRAFRFNEKALQDSANFETLRQQLIGDLQTALELWKADAPKTTVYAVPPGS